MKRKLSIPLLLIFMLSLLPIFTIGSISHFTANAQSEKQVSNESKWLTATEIGKLCINSFLYQGAIIDQIIPIENQEGYSGLCITYQNTDKKQDGYVIYSTKYEGIVSFGTHGNSPYHTLITIADSFYATSSTKTLIFENKLYTENFLDYSIRVNDSTTMFEISQKGIYELNDVKSSFNYGGFVTNLPTSNANLTIMSGLNSNSLNNFIPVDANQMNPYASGNCGPTAGTNMIKLWRELMGKTNLGSDQEVYSYIVNDVGENGLLMSSVANSTKRFAKSKGYTVNLYNYVGDFFSYFTRDIDAGYTILVSVGNDLSNCHLVVAVGYLTYSNSNVRYLRVLDGWTNNTNQYLNFDFYTRTAGYRWRIA